MKRRLSTTGCGDAPCEEPVLNGVQGQGIYDLVHAGESGQPILYPAYFRPTHPANPVLVLSKYQSKHEVVATSRIEEVTSPMVNTHCGHDGNEEGKRRDGLNQSSKQETVMGMTPLTDTLCTNFSKFL